MFPKLTIGRVPIYDLDGALAWVSGLNVDADGGWRAYAPPDSGLQGLDDLRNALHDVHDDVRTPVHGWAGVEIGDDGKPLVQGADDPFPGFYVSSTALGDRTRPKGDPRRYVDSESIPFYVMPPELHAAGVGLGDVGMAFCRRTSCCSPFIVGDAGPHNKLGEGSMKLAEALGLSSNPRNGGIDHGVVVVVWPGSARTPAWPRTVEDIAIQVTELIGQWGGLVRLRGAAL